jgi:hypothetical protein
MKFLGPPFNRLIYLPENFVPWIFSPAMLSHAYRFKMVPRGEHAFLQAGSPAGEVGHLDTVSVLPVTQEEVTK